ncbi:MAG TPA: LPS assembly protein LptD [Methylomirabilota bacterium]|nr:LPS assembly protein LptD [Methylomirabilota bacterium]
MLCPSAAWSLPGFLLVAALLLTPGTPAWAQAPSPKSPVTIRAGGQETTIVADQIQEVGGPTDLTIAVGNVEVTRGNTRLLADRIELNRDTGEAVAQGKVVFFDGGDRLVGDRIDYNLKTGTGVVYNGSAFSAPYYRLSGERMERVGEGAYTIRRGVFTTCEGDDPTWSFRLGSGTLQLDEFVYGTDASFWVNKIPVLPWVPFFAAALRRERQSGFLFPELGQTSRKGFFAKVPFYWAIGDSQDLTVSLDTFTKRGIGLEAEYRYILSRDSGGQFNGFGIHEGFRDTRAGIGLPENRGYASYRHAWQIDPSLAFKIDANVTSDDLVYRHYADRLQDRARQYAETNVFLTKRWEAWNLVGNVKWYQDLTTARPIELQRVPEIKLQGVRQPVPGLPAVLYEISGSYTQFVRYVGPEGPRADFHPRLYMPLPVAGVVTFTPFFGGRATYYNQRVVGQHIDMGGNTVQDSVNDDRVRLQVEAGVDIESRVSRVYMLDGASGIAALQHVIAPRASFIEIRGINQKAMPTYDPGFTTATGVDPGYERRVGIDRLGKANEVTYSISNALNAKTVSGPNALPVRWELARLVLSQTYNFNPVSQPFKDLYGDLTLQPTQQLRLHADARYNVYDLGLREANADIGANFRNFSVAVGPRFNEQSDQRTVKAEVTVKVLPNLDVRGATFFDVTNGVPVEARGGIDWRFDCWAIMVEYINRHRDENEVRFSINLLGLGQAGTTAKSGF